MAESEFFAGLLNNEISVLSKISHPNIIGIFEIMFDDNNYYIVSELAMYGNLFEYIVKNRRMTECKVKKVAHQMFLALNYLHQ